MFSDFISNTHTPSVVNFFIPVQPPLVVIRRFSRDSCLAARLPLCALAHDYTACHTYWILPLHQPDKSCHSNRLSEINSKGQVKGEKIKVGMTAVSPSSACSVCCPGFQEVKAHLKENKGGKDFDRKKKTKWVQLQNTVSHYAALKEFYQICTNYPKPDL